MRSYTKVSNMTKVQKMVFVSILVALSLILSYFESLIPINTAIIFPGAKLGLANIVVMISLYFLSFGEALILIVLKLIIGTILISSFSAFLYSLAGGMLSFIIMYILIHYFSKVFSIIIISVLGAISHNIGQLIVAGIIVENLKVIFFVPHLFIASIITGIAIGLSVKALLPYCENIWK